MFKAGLITLFCFFILLLSSCAHDDFAVSGVVSDRHGKVIQGVSMVCSTNPYLVDTVNTDSLGRFSITVFEGGLKLKGKSRIYLFKEGYRSRHALVRMNKINYVKLKKR